LKNFTFALGLSLLTFYSGVLKKPLHTNPLKTRCIKNRESDLMACEQFKL